MARSPSREILAELKTLPAFVDCSAADLTDLAGHSARTSVPAHWPLIQQETPSDACYVILHGAVDIVMDGATVASLASGAVVGELGIIDHKLRNATVTSTTPLDLLRIDRSEFGALLDRRPALKAVFLSTSRR